MVTPIRTWIYDVNRAVAGGSRLLKYRDIMFGMKQNLVGAVPVNLSGAWTLLDSCRGDGTAPAGTDVWATSADVRIAAADGTNHSWVYWRSPATMVPGGFIYMVWNCLSAVPATPATYEIWVSTNVFTGGTANTRPSSVGEAQANISAPNLITSDSACRAHALRNEVGEFVFLNSVNGSNVVRSSHLGLRPDNGEPGLDWPFIHFAAESPWNWNNQLDFTSYSTFYSQGGVPVVGAGRLTSAAQSMVSWVGGVSSGSPARSADCLIDAVGINAPQDVYVGRIQDIRGAPSLLPPNSDQQGDVDPTKRISVNGLWLPLVTPFTINL